MPPALFFFLRIALANLGFSWFCIDNFWFYSSQCISLSPPWWGLFLSIVFYCFDVVLKGVVFYILFLIFHC